MRRRRNSSDRYDKKCRVGVAIVKTTVVEAFVLGGVSIVLDGCVLSFVICDVVERF